MSALACLLPVLVLAVCLCASASGSAVASTSVLSPVPRVVWLDGRERYDGSLLPTGSLDRHSGIDSHQAELERSLDSFLNKELVDIVANYFHMTRAAIEAYLQGLYRELHHGKTDRLAELYDFKTKALKPHAVWEYFSRATLTTGLTLVHMLYEAWKHCKDKAILVFRAAITSRFPQIQSFANYYSEFGGQYMLLPHNLSPEEWPHVLTEDLDSWNAWTKRDWRLKALRIRFLLVRGKTRQLAEWIGAQPLDHADWFHVLGILNEIDPALLLDFYARLQTLKPAGEHLFNLTASIAIEVNPELGDRLKEQAALQGWTEPALSLVPITHVPVENGQVGGTVHMKPLVPFVQGATGRSDSLSYVVSPSRKAALSEKGSLFIAPGNLLTAALRYGSNHVHVRKLCGVLPSTVHYGSRPISVQHGDVIALTWCWQSPPFLEERVHCTHSQPVACLGCLEAFCFLAKYGCDFLAIVEDDK